MRKMVCFDCDGVLKDSERPVTAAFADHLRDYGLQITDADAFAWFRGKNATIIRPQVEAMFAAQSVAIPAGFETFVRDAEARIFHILGSLPELPGAVEAVQTALQLGFEICVVTNSRSVELDRKFRNSPLHDLVPANRRHTSDRVRLGKPAPDLYRAAADQAGIPVARCIAVEDSVPGVQSATAAPMTCIGLALHGGDEALRQAGAKDIAHSMHEVGALLAAFGRRFD